MVYVVVGLLSACFLLFRLFAWLDDQSTKKQSKEDSEYRENMRELTKREWQRLVSFDTEIPESEKRFIGRNAKIYKNDFDRDIVLEHGKVIGETNLTITVEIVYPPSSSKHCVLFDRHTQISSCRTKYLSLY